MTLIPNITVTGSLFAIGFGMMISLAFNSLPYPPFAGKWFMFPPALLFVCYMLINIKWWIL